MSLGGETLAGSFNLLRLVRREADAIGVAVSFGKDSLATLDLCCRVFSRVEAYYLYRVRRLDLVEDWAGQVYRRHGVRVRMYPHFDLSRCYRHAVLQPHWLGLEKTPRIKMTDIERRFRSDAEVEWIAYGWRRSDSRSRALVMKRCGGYDPKSCRLYPLRAWRRGDVFAYLDERDIPRPPGLGRKEQGGLDFHAGALAALSAEDRSRWDRDFPFAGVQSHFDAGQEGVGGIDLTADVTGSKPREPTDDPAQPGSRVPVGQRDRAPQDTGALIPPGAMTPELHPLVSASEGAEILGFEGHKQGAHDPMMGEGAVGRNVWHMPHLQVGHMSHSARRITG